MVGFCVRVMVLSALEVEEDEKHWVFLLAVGVLGEEGL